MSGKNKLIWGIVGIIIIYIMFVLAARFVNSHRDAGCLYQRKKLQAEYATYKDYCVGCNLPECTLLGNYLQQQWDNNSNYSWCSNKKGQLIYGTLTPANVASQPAQCPMNPIARLFYKMINQ